VKKKKKLMIWTTMIFEFQTVSFTQWAS